MMNPNNSGSSSISSSSSSGSPKIFPPPDPNARVGPKDGEGDPKKDPETKKLLVAKFIPQITKEDLDSDSKPDLEPVSESDFEKSVTGYIPGRSREETDQIWEQYLREIKESDGFTVNVYPGGPLAYLIPLPNFKKVKIWYDWAMTMATKALKDLEDQGKRYELVDVDRYVWRPGGDYYLTFTGRKLNVDAPSGDDVFETFQAHVALFDGDSDAPLIKCRIKPKPTSPTSTAPPN